MTSSPFHLSSNVFIFHRRLRESTNKRFSAITYNFVHLSVSQIPRTHQFAFLVCPSSSLHFPSPLMLRQTKCTPVFSCSAQNTPQVTAGSQIHKEAA